MGLAAVLAMLAAAPVGALFTPGAHATALPAAVTAAQPAGRSLGESDGEGGDGKKRGRAPSCGGCARREGVLTQTMRLQSYGRIFSALGPVTSALLSGALALAIGLAATYWLSREVIVTLVYVILYLVASPTAILVNKILMKDYGFGYPVMVTAPRHARLRARARLRPRAHPRPRPRAQVSAFGQMTTSMVACLLVGFGVETVENGRKVKSSSLFFLGGSSALALVLGQYPYLYLTVAFIQMLKAFSPALMVVLLSVMGVEYPSKRVILCVLGLSAFTAVASAGEVNLNVVGILFMACASCSDALRLVIAQKLLKNNRLRPIETLYYTSPVCLLWMVPAALATEFPLALKRKSFLLMLKHPLMFAASGLAGLFVNFTSFLVVKRTSSMTLKMMTMARNGALVIFSALVMGETITTLEAVGYSGLLFFFALYTYTKLREKEAPIPAASVEVKEGELVSSPEGAKLTNTNIEFTNVELDDDAFDAEDNGRLTPIEAARCKASMSGQHYARVQSSGALA